MSCRHCGRVISNQEELVAHLKYHERVIEANQRRDGPMTFGARYRKSKSKGDEHANAEEGTSTISQSVSARSSTVTSHSVISDDLHSPRNTQALHKFLSNVMSSDSSLLVFRRYAKLNIQTILYLQEVLADLESELESTCILPVAGDGTRVTRDIDKEARLMKQISETLETYNKAIIAQSQLWKLTDPEDSSVETLQAILQDEDGLDLSDSLYAKSDLQKREDLFAISQSKKSLIFKLIEEWIWRWASTNRFGGSLIQYSSKGTLYVYNDELIRLVVRVIITICSAIILIIPIIALHFVQSRTQSLIGVALGTTLVAIGMAVGTDCRDHEVLMAACAYGAVLIVFVAS